MTVMRALFASKRNCEKKRKEKDPRYSVVRVRNPFEVASYRSRDSWLHVKECTPNGREYLDTNACFTLDVSNIKSLPCWKKKKKKRGNQAIYVLLKLRFLETCSLVPVDIVSFPFSPRRMFSEFFFFFIFIVYCRVNHLCGLLAA